MAGGWGGTTAETWVVTGFPTGARTCNMTWLVTGQDAGAFMGTYQSSPGTADECGDAGTLDGNVSLSGGVGIHLHSTNSGGQCVLLSDIASTTYVGVVSSTGALTAQRVYSLRCAQPRGGSFDYRVTDTVSMNQR
jgi:hypothetical protein